MSISLGFFIILISIVLPGLIFRRLYFHGEFSKQFNGGLSVLGLIAAASIPGLFFFMLSFLLADFFSLIDGESIINAYISAFKIEENDTSLDILESYGLYRDDVLNFFSLLFVSCAVLGFIFGRIVTLLKLDIRFKLLRFKNYWHYLFNNRAAQFKKFKHIRNASGAYAETVADVLVETNDGTALYSGTILDYQIRSGTCNELSSITLRSAKRYKKSSKKSNKKVVTIPGSFLVVECSRLLNINITYIYKSAPDRKSLALAPIVLNLFSFLVIMALFVFPFFKFEFVNYDWYQKFISEHWLIRMFICLYGLQFLNVLLPYTKESGEYKRVPSSDVKGKLVMLGLFTIIFYFLVWV